MAENEIIFLTEGPIYNLQVQFTPIKEVASFGGYVYFTLHA
jgi:hypothetical protein